MTERVGIVRLNSEAREALDNLPGYVSKQRFVGYVLKGSECRMQVYELANDRLYNENSDKIIKAVKKVKWL